MKYFIFLLFICGAFGCAPQERQRAYLIPGLQDDAYAYYRFQTFADATNPEKSQKAEASRMRDLEEALHRAETKHQEYEILSREVVKKPNGIAGNNIYEIMYEVRVKKSLTK